MECIGCWTITDGLVLPDAPDQFSYLQLPRQIPVEIDNFLPGISGSALSGGLSANQQGLPPVTPTLREQPLSRQIATFKPDKPPLRWPEFSSIADSSNPKRFRLT